VRVRITPIWKSFCAWSDFRLQLWESPSSINNQALIYQRHAVAQQRWFLNKTRRWRGEDVEDVLIDALDTTPATLVSEQNPPLAGSPGAAATIRLTDAGPVILFTNSL